MISEQTLSDHHTYFSYNDLQGGDLPAEAGVIPRAVRQIFDTLEAQNADYSIKVTFSELYNEENN
jgi:hypothetical protein